MNQSTEYNFTQELVLPSKGLLNPEIPEGKVTQRCMMLRDQKILAGSNKDAGSKLNALIQDTITSPENFDISKLTVPDTIYLLFKLRILSYGKDYKFVTRCPECGKKITSEIDLSELCVETLESDYADRLVVKLPHRKDEVHVKLMTNADNEEVEKEISRRKKRNPNDESAYLLRIVYGIEKIKLTSGEKKELTHPIDIERYVESLTDLDASAILSVKNNIDYGIKPDVEIFCPECRESIDVSVNFSGEFFRPTIKF